MGIKAFFKKAFDDMKESAEAQHEVDKANMAAVKAESKAQWEEAKAIGDPNRRKAVFQAQRDEQIAEANERKAAAEARIDAAKNKSYNKQRKRGVKMRLACVAFADKNEGVKNERY